MSGKWSAIRLAIGFGFADRTERCFLEHVEVAVGALGHQVGLLSGGSLRFVFISTRAGPGQLAPGGMRNCRAGPDNEVEGQDGPGRMSKQNQFYCY